MERESLLVVLIVLLGGAALQLFAVLPRVRIDATAARHLEQAHWLRLWSPLAPALLLAAWLCGWALSQPDPVPHRVGLVVFIACAPFALLIVRAVFRAGWSLTRRFDEYGIATIGLVRPHVVVSPDLAKRLDDRALRAALEHERAHVRHRDPLRIWIAQCLCDLQWPWPCAKQRFDSWLAVLECARDEEARAAGVDGADLAAAVIASLRFHRGPAPQCRARLIGNRTAIEERVARLLRPLPEAPPVDAASAPRAVWLLLGAALLAVALGVLFGERLIGPFLRITS